jgi:hypothetical protein
MGGKSGMSREKLNAYRVFVEKHEGKRRLRRPKHKWENDTKWT